MKPLVLGLCALAPLAWSALKRARVDVGPLLRPALSRFRLGGAGPTDEEDVDLKYKREMRSHGDLRLNMSHEVHDYSK